MVINYFHICIGIIEIALLAWHWSDQRIFRGFICWRLPAVPSSWYTLSHSRSPERQRGKPCFHRADIKVPMVAYTSKRTMSLRMRVQRISRRCRRLLLPLLLRPPRTTTSVSYFRAWLTLPSCRVCYSLEPGEHKRRYMYTLVLSQSLCQSPVFFCFFFSHFTLRFVGPSGRHACSLIRLSWRLAEIRLPGDSFILD